MEEETAGLRHLRTRQAIDLAMQGRWREAVTVNQSLVANFPSDVSAYNRLGRAYMELGEFSHALEAYRRAVELDPYNTIALRNLERLSHLREAMVGSEEGSQVEPLHFIEETGKAGVVNLQYLGPPEVVAKMVAGDRVYLKARGSSLIVENGRGEYLGQVEPKIAQRLTRLMAGGNEYAAALVSSAENAASIIIREVYQHPSQVGRLSFPPKELRSPRPYVSERVTRREPTLEYGEEEEEEAAGLEEEAVGLGEEAGYSIVGVEEKESSVGKSGDAGAFSEE